MEDYVKESYVSPEMEVLQVVLHSRIMEGTNTEPIDDGGTVPGF